VEKTHNIVNVAQLHGFDEIVDVRSPAEYERDHIPGAINCPVLDDNERARVGTIHARESAFAARKVGAALVARNIARHLETVFADKPRNWAPLVYCWRGGKRSAAMALVLRQTGWDAKQLAGGYKAFRRHVITETNQLASAQSFKVICGLTGSGKSALLSALQQLGAQVLDLEGLAHHRGSVLGDMPRGGQPAQKKFESRLWKTLQGFDPSQCVFVEAESQRIGNLYIPTALIEGMRASPCLLLETPESVRVDLLLREYAHFIEQPQQLYARLDCLKWLHGKACIEQWKSLAADGEWAKFVSEILAHHYDPAYRKSSAGNYSQLIRAYKLTVDNASDAHFESIARRLMNERGTAASACSRPAGVPA
jgi:tRNA 2-selenouridine synthase